MNLIFRLMWILLARRWRTRNPILGPCSTPFRVLPNDLDLLMHMNNGRYFSLMDAARVDMMARSGFWTQSQKLGWYPVVVHETLSFYRSLKLWQAFEVRTHVIAWDDKHILVQQDFYRGAQLMAGGIVKARFLKKSGGSVPVADLLALGNVDTPSPALPDWAAAWNAEHDRATVEKTQR
jgi:YbgC/YbaW family acyl-CoA thioester hydrolase